MHELEQWLLHSKIMLAQCKSDLDVSSFIYNTDLGGIIRELPNIIVLQHSKKP